MYYHIMYHNGNPLLNDETFNIMIIEDYLVHNKHKCLYLLHNVCITLLLLTHLHKTYEGR